MKIEKFNPKLSGYKFILASQSPRRKQLLQELGLPFTIEVRSVVETYPETLSAKDTAIFLAEKKSTAFPIEEIPENVILIFADTVVAADDEILGKPKDHTQAVEILKKLSGKSHQVITGVFLKARNQQRKFGVSTKVMFKELTDIEIDYYVENFKPFDKAGAYGIQEWIGVAAIQGIEGSYFNVVGLPVHELYEQLLKW